MDNYIRLDNWLQQGSCSHDCGIYAALVALVKCRGTKQNCLEHMIVDNWKAIWDSMTGEQINNALIKEIKIEDLSSITKKSLSVSSCVQAKWIKSNIDNKISSLPKNKAAIVLIRRFFEEKKNKRRKREGHFVTIHENILYDTYPAYFERNIKPKLEYEQLTPYMIKLGTDKKCKNINMEWLKNAIDTRCKYNVIIVKA